MKRIWINKMNTFKQSIIFSGVCLFALISLGTSQFAKAADDVTEKSKTSTQLKLDDFRKFKKGISRQDFVKEVGSPWKKVGKDMRIYIYPLADGTEMRVGFNSADQLYFIDHNETILE